MDNWNAFFQGEQRSVRNLMKANPAYRKLFAAFDELTEANQALDPKTAELIALACTVLTGCEFCMRAHAEKAAAAGCTREEITAAIAIAQNVNNGIAVVKGGHVLEAFDSVKK